MIAILPISLPFTANGLWPPQLASAVDHPPPKPAEVLDIPGRRGQQNACIQHDSHRGGCEWCMLEMLQHACTYVCRCDYECLICTSKTLETPHRSCTVWLETLAVKTVNMQENVGRIKIRQWQCCGLWVMMSYVIVRKSHASSSNPQRSCR